MKRQVAAYMKVLPPHMTAGVPLKLQVLQDHKGEYAFSSMTGRDRGDWVSMVRSRRALADEARAILEFVEGLARDGQRGGPTKEPLCVEASDGGVQESKGPE